MANKLKNFYTPEAMRTREYLYTRTPVKDILATLIEKTELRAVNCQVWLGISKVITKTVNSSQMAARNKATKARKTEQELISLFS